MNTNLKITPFSIDDAAVVADLHIDGIRTGFLSSLGNEFVSALYKAIAKSELGFGLVAKDNSNIIGFIVFTTNIKKLYKSVITKNFCRFTFLLVRKTFSLKQIKKIFETLFYPSRIKNMNLPSAELLSIVVIPNGQGRGIGATLLRQGLKVCANSGIEEVKVLVGADNEPANKLYIKFGFELKCQIENHGILSNIYTVRACTSL